MNKKSIRHMLQVCGLIVGAIMALVIISLPGFFVGRAVGIKAGDAQATTRFAQMAAAKLSEIATAKYIDATSMSEQQVVLAFEDRLGFIPSHVSMDGETVLIQSRRVAPGELDFVLARLNELGIESGGACLNLAVRLGMPIRVSPGGTFYGVITDDIP